MTKHAPSSLPIRPGTCFKLSVTITSSVKLSLHPGLLLRPPKAFTLIMYQKLFQVCYLHPGISPSWASGNMCWGPVSLCLSSGEPQVPHLMCLKWERMRSSWARRRCCCCRVRPALAIRWIKVSVILSRTRWMWSFSSRDFRVLDRNVYTPECAKRQ